MWGKTQAVTDAIAKLEKDHPHLLDSDDDSPDTEVVSTSTNAAKLDELDIPPIPGLYTFFLFIHPLFLYVACENHNYSFHLNLLKNAWANNILSSLTIFYESI